MGAKVCEAIMSILNRGGMASSLNETFIDLIPKKSNADCVSKF